MQQSSKYIFASLVAYLALASFAFAVGVAVVPGELFLKVQVNATMSARMMVSNPSKDVMIFEVYPDDFDRAITISPKSFTLESAEKQQVQLEIRMPSEGVFKTNISVVGRPLSSNAFAATTGIKVPLTVTAETAESGLASAITFLRENVWLGFIALSCAAFLVWRNKKTTQPSV